MTNEECPICYKELNILKGFSITNCKHKFCTDCLVKALQINPSCPNCRAQVAPKLNLFTQEDINESYENGFVRGVYETEIENSDSELIRLISWDRGYQQGQRLSRNIIVELIKKYERLEKIYRGTLIQLQNTHVLNLVIKKKHNLLRSVSAE